MLEIRCKTCKATGVIPSENTFDAGCKPCPPCGGKGYTEHEGDLKDLELAQATKLAFENQHIPFTKITELVKWYREQKGGK